MNTDLINVDIDAAFRGIESRYHKKRLGRKTKKLYPSMANDGATTEDEEEGIVITDDDIMTPRKPTSHYITLVGTDGIASRPPKGLTVPSATILRNNLVDAMVARPYYRRTMTFQSFHLPTKPRIGDVTSRSAKTDVKKSHHQMREIPRRNRNTLRKLPLYRMKTDLKRKLHKLERKLSRIKKDEVIEKISAIKQPPPSPPETKTPTHITGLISETLGKPSRSGPMRSSSGNRRQYSSRELMQKISESSQNLQKLEYELSARREEQQQRARSVSIKSSPKSVYKLSPLLQDESDDIVIPSQQALEGSPEEKPAPKKPRSIRSRQDQTKQAGIKPAKKKLRKRKPRKKKANLRGFKQEIPIEGMPYKMEITLEADLIARTRAGNIDFRKDPKLMIKTTKATDLRDEFSSYCGQRKGIKNWLFQV